MFPKPASFGEIKLERDPFGKVLDAIVDCDYPVLYACLNREPARYLPHQAYILCSWAIRSGCSREAFQAILDHSAPLEEILCANPLYNYVIPGHTGSLVQEAAVNDRGEILDCLLERGGSPNASGERECSALEAALWHRSVHALAVLLERDDVDCSVTETMRNLWGALGQDPEQDACLRLAAGKLLGFDREGEELPLLPGMDVLHAARRENWPLVCRMCRETSVSEKQGKQVVELLMTDGEALDPAMCAPVLDALFSVCPGLLRCEYPRYVLTLCLLCGDETVVERLRPWRDRLPGQQIVLAGRRLGERSYDLPACLSNWKERMGDRLQPVLQRGKLLPVRKTDAADERIVEALLKTCRIRGNPPSGRPSRLAVDVLTMADLPLLVWLYEEEILLPQEDTAALISFLETAPTPQREKRNLLLAYGRKRVNYEL